MIYVCLIMLGIAIFSLCIEGRVESNVLLEPDDTAKEIQSVMLTIAVIILIGLAYYHHSLPWYLLSIVASLATTLRTINEILLIFKGKSQVEERGTWHHGN